MQQAVAWLREADGLLVTAGPGMGVDSGLPDFRGNAGLWRVYSAIVKAKGFQSIANPRALELEPELAWGFYGHCLRLYREFECHPSFAVLKGWGEHAERGVFVFTNNVDGQFQRVRFPEDGIEECHDSIHYLQSTQPCSSHIEAAPDFTLQVDQRACRHACPLLRCRRCGAVSRPDILMFWDSAWLSSRADAQAGRRARWVASVKRLVVVKVGAAPHCLLFSVLVSGVALVSPASTPRTADWSCSRYQRE